MKSARNKKLPKNYFIFYAHLSTTNIKFICLQYFCWLLLAACFYYICLQRNVHLFKAILEWQYIE